MTIQKEDRLIFLFARGNLNEEERGQIEDLVKNSLDWEYVLKKSQREGVSPLVYYHLNNFKLKREIYPHLETLKKDYYRNAINNTRAAEGAKKILKAFNEEKIKPIILKGLFLLQNIYKYPALRPMIDIDILIKRADLYRVNEILNSMGYFPPPHYRDFLDNSFLSSINTLSYINHNPQYFPVDLHWHLINTTWPLDFFVGSIDMQRIWSCAQATTIDGVDTSELAPEHLLIYLSQHSFLHNFDRLILFCDIAEVLRYYQDRLNWDLVREEAETFNLSYIVYHSLSFASRALKFEIPQLEKLKPDKDNFLEKIVSPFISKGIHSYKLFYLAYLSRQKGVLSKLKFIGRTIFPSRYVIAHNFMLPSSQIRPRHYYQRVVSKFRA